MRLAFISIFHAASRICWIARACALFNRSSDCDRSSFARAEFACSVLWPIGYEMLTPTLHVGKLFAKSWLSTDPEPEAVPGPAEGAGKPPERSTCVPPRPFA